MAVSGGVNAIAARYAKALLQHAEEEAVVDALAHDLRTARALARESADFRRLIESLTLPRDQQGHAIALVARHLEMTVLMEKFLGVLVRNRRLAALTAIAERYASLLSERRGEITVRLTTATALDKTRADALEATLNDAFEHAVTIERFTDPDLIGGLVARIGSRIVDASVKTQLRKLRLAMKGA